MSYTQEMQLLSYYANDIADIVMSYTHDIRYGEDTVIGSFCGVTVTFTQDDYIFRIQCTDFDLMFNRKFVTNVANDDSKETYPIYTKARFLRGSEEDLRRWRLKLYQFRHIAA